MNQPIIPPNHGLTPEAMEAMGMEAEPQDIVSDATDDNGVGGPFFATYSAGPLPDGDSIDNQPTEELTEEKPARRGRRERREETGEAREAKAGPPSLDEWVKFFSNVLLRVGTEFYITLAFRGIDEDALTERDVERLALTDEERKLIATPFAELSHKSKLMRKHGRMIVASGDALNALVVLGMWFSRVNRIAAKYRPKVQKGKVTLNGSSGQGATNAAYEGSQGGRFAPGWEGQWSNPGSG
jgi:hypothetical protein